MKLIRALAYTVLGLVFLSLFGWAVKGTNEGNRPLGILSKPLQVMIDMPDKVWAVITSSTFTGISDSYLERKDDKADIQLLQEDLIVSNSFWDEEHDRWAIKLFNFRTDEVLDEWWVERGGPWVLDLTDRQFQNAPPVHPLVLPGGRVIMKLEKTPNLACLDPDSKVLWVNNELVFHHAIQPDPDGTSFWVCASDLPMMPGRRSIGRSVRNLYGRRISYTDDYVVRVDIATGRILYKKGVAAMLLENGREGVLYAGTMDDPIHLNDIMPAADSSAFWQPGDLFLSAKRRSVLLLYRPSLDSIVDVITGPFFNQHDVNILSDHEISLFDNRVITGLQYPRRMDNWLPPLAPKDTLRSSAVWVYDLRERSFRAVRPEVFRSERIRTGTQGIHELLPNGDLFVEAQNMGLYYVIAPDGAIRMRKAMPAARPGYVHGPNWTRVYPHRP